MSEQNLTLTLPLSLAKSFGAPRVVVYYEALVEGAIIYGVWDGERRIRPSAEQEADLVGMIVEHARATRTYTEARHSRERDAAKPNPPSMRWAGMAGRARRSA